MQNVTNNATSMAAANLQKPLKETVIGTTRSAISPGTVTITNDAAQQALTGKTVEETIASLNRETTTANDSVKPIFDLQKIERQQEIDRVMADVAQQAAPILYNTVGDVLRGQPEAVKVAVHGLIGGLMTKALGGEFGRGAIGVAAATAAVALLDGQLGDLGLSQTDRNALLQSIGMTVAYAASGGSAQTALTASLADQFNRQLHPDEKRWLEANAKNFAKQQGISEQEAMERLAQQALKQEDYLWRAQLGDGDDAAAHAFLMRSGQTFINELGEKQTFFTATGQQLFRPEMFADTADAAFYKQFVQSGISRDFGIGLAKELKDSGIALKDGVIDLAKLARDNPEIVLNGVWNAVKNLPKSVVDGFIETGHALGEGSAVALNKDLSSKLNSIYGTDVEAAQQALVAIRVTASIVGAAGVARAGQATAEAIVKKLDDVAAIKTEAKVIADRMREVAIHRDDTRLGAVAEEIAEAQKAGWKTGDGKIWWPPENGKVPGTEFQTTLAVGTKLDRYGAINDSTDFLAPAGTPLPQRALPAGSDSRPLIQLRVLKPLPVEQSNVMPWFDQPGLGVQYQTTAGSTGHTVEKLIDLGYLEVIK